MYIHPYAFKKAVYAKQDEPYGKENADALGVVNGTVPLKARQPEAVLVFVFLTDLQPFPAHKLRHGILNKKRRRAGRKRI